MSQLEGEVEFVNLINMYHVYYKQTHDLKKNSIFFENEQEMKDFKNDMIDSEKNKYFEEYYALLNKDLLKEHHKLFYAKIDGVNKYTSGNVIYLIKHLISLG